jgi:hypothetical protein
VPFCQRAPLTMTLARGTPRPTLRLWGWLQLISLDKGPLLLERVPELADASAPAAIPDLTWKNVCWAQIGSRANFLGIQREPCQNSSHQNDVDLCTLSALHTQTACPHHLHPSQASQARSRRHAIRFMSISYFMTSC